MTHLGQVEHYGQLSAIAQYVITRLLKDLWNLSQSGASPFVSGGVDPNSNGTASIIMDVSLSEISQGDV
ncbi:MAG: hypothetical protein IGR80_13400 [Synechococcales cyanobacterium K44_A2020_017]|nr:hypothetical protein [Synechococcales cyanobacterium K32_A2020_035]MBF2095739.1 hypothetical protein [Synechococcales cyanobacterium K44_A2020_017]